MQWNRVGDHPPLLNKYLAFWSKEIKKYEIGLATMVGKSGAYCLKTSRTQVALHDDDYWAEFPYLEEALKGG